MVKRFLPLAGALLLACGDRAAQSGDVASGELALATKDTPAGTVSWVTIDGVDFPARMANAPDEVKEAYVFAAQHPEVLQYMPCYCGCENENPPHQSNMDCFVDQIDRTGERPRVHIDPMGFG